MEVLMKFAVACRQFFGLLPGETLIGFAKELKELTDADREEIRSMLQNEMHIAIEF
jgi:hypothetical protein